MKKIILSSEEKYIQNALKENKAIFMHFSMKQLGNPDHSLQARVIHLDMDHVKRLSNIHDQTDSLAPVIIFKEKENKYWLADGFHRHKVYMIKKEYSIPAYVIEGSKRDAIEFSTMCNKILCLPRKSEDIEKAIKILFDIEAWLYKADTIIAKHIGCSTPTVVRVRALYCKEKNIPIPNIYTTSTGEVRSRGMGRPVLTPDKKQSGNIAYRSSVKGKLYSLGTNKEEAEKKLDNILKGITLEEKQFLNHNEIITYFARKGITIEYIRQNRMDLRGLSGLLINDHILIWSNFQREIDLPTAVGQGLLLKQALKLNTSVIILCPIERINQTQKIIAEELGIEFLTSKDLIEGFN